MAHTKEDLAAATDMGRRARYEDKPITDCPFSLDLKAKAAWRRGWNAANEAKAVELLKTMQPAPKRKPGGYYRGH